MLDLFKKILGIKSLEEKAEEYVKLQEQSQILKSEISDLADSYLIQTNYFNKSLSEPANQAVQKQIQSKYNQYLIDHVYDVRNIKEKYDKLNSEIDKLEKSDDRFLDAVQKLKEIKAYEIIKGKYKSNILPSSNFNDIIKAKKGRVNYADMIVYDNSGRLLLLLRSNDSDFAPNTWSLPGGHVDLGEDFDTAAKRELQEETGLEVKKCEKVGEYSDKDSIIEYHQVNLEDKESPEVILESSEHQSYKWILLSEFLEDEEMEGIMNLKDNLKKIYLPIERNIEIIKKALESGEINWDNFEKAGGHKYIRREGTPGNYKYIYEENKESNNKEFSDEQKNLRDYKLWGELLDYYMGNKKGQFDPSYKYSNLGKIGLRISDHSGNYKNYGEYDVSIVTHELDPTKDKFISDNENISGLSKEESIKKIDSLLLNKLKEFDKGFKISDADELSEYMQTINGLYDSAVNVRDEIEEIALNRIKKIDFEDIDYTDVYDFVVRDFEGNLDIELDDPDSFNKSERGDVKKSESEIIKKAKLTGQDKVAWVMKEFKEGRLKDSHGKKVTDRKQALAIAMSEAGFSKADSIEDKISGGLADKKTVKDLEKKYKLTSDEAKRKLIQGAKVESEHTDDKKIAVEIAMDHLWEDKDYYDKLATIEKAFKQGKISEELFEKARKGVYADNAQNRKLKRVGKPYGSSGGVTPDEDKKSVKQDENGGKQGSDKLLDDHAKEASGSALEIAAKESKDQEVRIAANKELDRREKEEKVSEKEEESKPSQEKDEKSTEKESSSKKSTKEPETKEEIEAEIKRLRDEDIDYSDEKALDENLKKIKDFQEKRKQVLEKEKGLRKVEFKEYRKGFKKLETSPDPHKPDEATDYYKEESKNIKATDQELADITDYVGENYSYVRKFLSNQDEYKEEYGDDDLMEPMINGISSFIAKNKIKENISLNRRVKGDGVKFFKGLKDGDVYEDKSFSSTSLTEQSLFGDFNIEILAKKGSSVANIDNPNELEYLIDKGAKFRVLKTSEKGIIVELL